MTMNGNQPSPPPEHSHLTFALYLAEEALRAVERKISAAPDKDLASLDALAELYRLVISETRKAANADS